MPAANVSGWLGLALALCLILGGCRTTAPIYVWEPAQVDVPSGARVALAPVAGPREIADRIEGELLAQRPAASADVELFTADQLAQSSPIRLASTAALTSDLTAIHAARAIGADILLLGEILASQVEAPEEKPEVKNVNMNELFFQRREEKPPKQESLLLSWRVIDTQTARTLGTQSFTIRTQDALDQYPDLELTHHDRTALLFAACARETWKSLSPVVQKDRVRLAVPWLQLGAWRVRRGVAAARQGQWQLAEEQWSNAAQRFPFNAAAQHNLAIALAAREDFVTAKQRLNRATGLLAFRLPGETLFWLDQNHRRYHEAHGLEKPLGGWAFPEPIPSDSLQSASPIDMEDLPWWTAVPFTKPPGWSWQSWLRQPLVL